MITWLADVLRTSGVAVIEFPGWKTRGRPASVGGFFPRAVVWHHDASPKGDSPGGPVYIVNGRPGEGDPGPLSQVWVDRSGAWHVLAAGRANHAGLGDHWGVIPMNEANTYSIGVETDHTVGEVWPAAQLVGLRVGTAAILERLSAHPENALCGHKEYAPDRKVDPDGLDLDSERLKVAALMRRPDAGGDDDVAAKDVWDYKMESKVPAHAGKSYTAEAFLTAANRDAHQAVIDIAGVQAQIDELAKHVGATEAEMTAAAEKGVSQALAKLAADVADGPDA